MDMPYNATMNFNSVSFSTITWIELQIYLKIKWQEVYWNQWKIWHMRMKSLKYICNLVIRYQYICDMNGRFFHKNFMSFVNHKEKAHLLYVYALEYNLKTNHQLLNYKFSTFNIVSRIYRLSYFSLIMIVIFSLYAYDTICKVLFIISLFSIEI